MTFIGVPLNNLLFVWQIPFAPTDVSVTVVSGSRVEVRLTTLGLHPQFYEFLRQWKS